MGSTDRIASTTPYTHGYYKALSPALMTAVLELQGLQPPDLARPLNYCELGIGFGVSVVANAVCFPNIRFHGNDFNPSHVAYARQLARDAGVDNVALFDDSFEQMLARDLPAMDFIVLHGIWSWVSPDTRRLLVEFIDKRLAKGGVVYVSHNVLPGWSALMPLREWMYLHSARMSPENVGPDERARAVLAAATQLQACAPASLAGPAVASHLASLPDADPAYIAHEYLVPDWHPLYFHQVAGELGGAGLEHAGSAVLEQNLDGWLETAQSRSLVGVADPLLKESLRDYQANTLFRRDLYTRKAAPLSLREHVRRLQERRWMLVNPLEEITLARLPAELSKLLQDMPVRPLLEALGQGPLTLEQARQLPGLRGVDEATLLGALLLVAEPVLPEAATAAARARVRRFNDVALERAGRDGLNILLSPRTGQATRWTGASMHLIRLHLDGMNDVDAIAPAWRDRLAAAGHAVKRDGVELSDPADRLDYLKVRARAYLGGQVPKLEELGVL